MEATTGRLGISDMAGIFVVFVASIALALCALIVEYIYAACSDRRLDKAQVCSILISIILHHRFHQKFDRCFVLSVRYF